MYIAAAAALPGVWESKKRGLMLGVGVAGVESSLIWVLGRVKKRVLRRAAKNESVYHSGLGQHFEIEALVEVEVVQR